MSSTVVTREPWSAPAERTVLRRTMAAEWTKLWTIRSTWWALGAATLAAVVLVLTADVAAGIALGDNAEVVTVDVVDSLGAVAALVASGAVMTLGIGALVRSSAGTLTTLFMLWLVLPTMLPAFGVQWLATIGHHLPGSAGMALLNAFGDPALSTTRAVVVLTVWLTVTVAAALTSLTRRDAA